MTVEEFIGEWHDNKDYIIAHTSGPTGKPKEVRLLKSDMRCSARATNQFFNIGKNSRLMLCLSPDYIAGKMMIVRALEANAELIVESPSNHPLSDYDGSRIDLIAVVPSQALFLANHVSLLNNVSSMIVGGGEIAPELWEKLAVLPYRIYSTYGMTETCSHVALAKISREKEPYKALPGVEFAVDDRDCLIIKAPKYSFGKLVTNDIVRLLSPLSFKWIGRYDNVINTGGIKVFPEEVEQKIAHIIPTRFYIGSRKSEKWGNEVVLFMECDGLSDYQKDIIMADISKILSPIERPKDIIFLEKFQETSSGKIKRDKQVK